MANLDQVCAQPGMPFGERPPGLPKSPGRPLTAALQQQMGAGTGSGSDELPASQHAPSAASVVGFRIWEGPRMCDGCSSKSFQVLVLCVVKAWVAMAAALGLCSFWHLTALLISWVSIYDEHL